MPPEYPNRSSLQLLDAPGDETENGEAITFPGNEAGNHAKNNIDLNDQLVRNKSSTFFFRMNSDAMTGAGIFSGDTLIVDRSITHVNGKVVIAILNGELLVRRLEKTINHIRLLPETNNLAVIEVDPYAEFAVWGVVTYSIHSV
ncbi:MAG: translesion error-prone DNA polymerase V autoproteolytic subunit [Chitinophagaceae bacterium]|nr:translesion error-prone DNA polymerase V autoproteolytic subunit [Chitinophagaceae bacterium]